MRTPRIPARLRKHCLPGCVFPETTHRAGTRVHSRVQRSGTPGPWQTRPTTCGQCSRESHVWKQEGPRESHQRGLSTPWRPRRPRPSSARSPRVHVFPPEHPGQRKHGDSLSTQCRGGGGRGQTHLGSEWTGANLVSRRNSRGHTRGRGSRPHRTRGAFRRSLRNWPPSRIKHKVN